VGNRGCVDVAPYQPLVDRAEHAFGQDFGYAEAMLKAGAAILNKRAVWSLRTELREVEQIARTHCFRDGRECEAVSPCGFGDCRYAEDKNAAVVVLSTKGRQQRVPNAAPAFPSYDRELVVTYVLWQGRIAS
jgi:hypothetical protein